MDLDLYEILKRIEFEGNIEELNLDLLSKLCLCFMSTIPFENLDLFGGREKNLDLERIYRDIVTKRRGGLCCELNGLFHWLLVKIGFNVEILKAYPFLAELDNKFDDVGDHMNLLVTLEGGEKYLTDVGWGGTSFSFPLSIKNEGKEQVLPNGIYRLIPSDGFYVLEKKKREVLDTQNNAGADLCPEWYPLYRFKLINQKLKDFEYELNYATGIPYFTTQYKVIFQNDEGRKFLLGKKFVRKQYVKPNSIKLIEEREILQEELLGFLEQEFGLSVDFELDFCGYC